MICCTNNPSAHSCTFCKCWSFIWRCFFPVSILKTVHIMNLKRLNPLKKIDSENISIFKSNTTLWKPENCSSPEAAPRGVLWKKVFLEISQEVCNFIKKVTLAQMFSCKFSEIFKTTVFTKHLWTIVSASHLCKLYSPQSRLYDMPFFYCLFVCLIL